MRDDIPQYAPRPTPAQHNPHHHEDDPRPPGVLRSNAHLAVATGIALVIVGIIAGVTYHEATATRAAVAAAVPKPTAQPGPPVPQPVRGTKPVEKSPPVGAIVKGDGTWIIGKEIRRGTYRSEGGQWCFWERLRDLSGEPDGVMSKGFVKGPQVVAMGTEDVAFSTQGCGSWVKVP